MIYPNYEKFKQLSDNSKMVPVSLEISGDTETPITLFKKLCKTPNCYLLESIEGGEKWGRYSYIGRKPFITVKAYGKQVIINKEKEVIYKNGNPMEIIKEIIDEYNMVEMSNMPDFIGGAVGYIGYDTIRNYENLPNINEDDLKMPECDLMFAEELVIYDHVCQKIKLVVNMEVSSNLDASYKNATERLYAIKHEILNSTLKSNEEKKYIASKVAYSSNETKEEYISKVLKAKEYIKNGDIFQVVLSQRLKVDTKVEPFHAYRVLRSINPSPYMYYIDFEEYHIVGSSPELLIKLKGEELATCPIAGTRPRGKTIDEDEGFAKELLEDKKERAEHLMLVDLARNDIGRIAKFGTVELSEFMKIGRYSHVMHIVSTVIGKIKHNYDMYQALFSCMPAGTVSGAPKIRAMEIIDELENKKRGVYAGAIGYLGFNGNMDTCIAIRTMVFKEGAVYIQAGAGIVADSDPESEYNETIRKASALLETITIAEEGVF